MLGIHSIANVQHDLQHAAQALAGLDLPARVSELANRGLSNRHPLVKLCAKHEGGDPFNTVGDIRERFHEPLHRSELRPVAAEARHHQRLRIGGNQMQQLGQHGIRQHAAVVLGFQVT